MTAKSDGGCGRRRLGGRGGWAAAGAGRARRPGGGGWAQKQYQLGALSVARSAWDSGDDVRCCAQEGLGGGGIFGRRHESLVTSGASAGEDEGEC